MKNSNMNNQSDSEKAMILSVSAEFFRCLNNAAYNSDVSFDINNFDIKYPYYGQPKYIFKSDGFFYKKNKKIREWILRLDSVKYTLTGTSSTDVISHPFLEINNINKIHKFYMENKIQRKKYNDEFYDVLTYCYNNNIIPINSSRLENDYYLKRIVFNSEYQVYKIHIDEFTKKLSYSISYEKLDLTECAKNKNVYSDDFFQKLTNIDMNYGHYNMKMSYYELFMKKLLILKIKNELLKFKNNVFRINSSLDYTNNNKHPTLKDIYEFNIDGEIYKFGLYELINLYEEEYSISELNSNLQIKALSI